MPVLSLPQGMWPVHWRRAHGRTLCHWLRGDTLRKRRQRAAVLSAAVLAPEAELARVDKRRALKDAPQCTGAVCTEAEEALLASKADGVAMAVDLLAEFDQMALDTDALDTGALKGAQELLEHSWQLPAWPMDRDSRAAVDVESFVPRLLERKRGGKGKRSAAAADTGP